MAARELLCPYCFALFPPDTALFRCVDASRCGHLPDLELTEYQLGKVPRGEDGQPLLPLFAEGRLFPASPGSAKQNGVPQAGCCPNCQRESSKLTCPRCHNTLPFQFGWYESYPIALVGAKHAGKSNYIGVIIEELRRRIAPAFNAPLEAIDDQTRTRYSQQYRLPLYELNEVVPQTLSAVNQSWTKYPLCYRLKLRRDGLFGEQRKMVDLTFFDTAGEDLLSADIMSVHTRYIGHARGVVLLLDPLQIPEVRRLVQLKVELPAPNPAQEDIIERVTQLVQSLQGCRSGQKIKIPLAVAFSKIDALMELVDPALLQAVRHAGVVELADLDRCHRHWCRHLEEWGHGHLKGYLDTSYEQWRFFGLSALGSPAESGRLPRGLNPFRVEDPLLWLLHVNKIVEGRAARRGGI